MLRNSLQYNRVHHRCTDVQTYKVAVLKIDDLHTHQIPLAKIVYIELVVDKDSTLVKQTKQIE